MNILAINCVGARRCGDPDALGYVLGKAAEYPFVTIGLVAVAALIVTAALKRSRNKKAGA